MAISSPSARQKEAFARYCDTISAAGLIGGIEKRAIVIADYDPAWPERFQEQAHVIRRALGDAALRVEHIGSTSVPGLPAKPEPTGRP